MSFKNLPSLKLTAIFLIVALCFCAAPAFAATADNFTLKDQFGNEISVRFPADRPVILIFGDREGSAHVEGWVRPLYNKFGDGLYIFGIADLSAVPWAVRPVIRQLIRRKSKNPIMLDWSGAVSDSFGCKKGQANLFLLTPQGTTAAVKRGAATTSALNDLYEKINALK